MFLFRDGAAHHVDALLQAVLGEYAEEVARYYKENLDREYPYLTEADMDAIEGSVHAILGTDHALEDLFHMQVAKAADSPVLYGYLQAVYRQLQGTAYPQLQEKLLTDYADHEMREHQEIFESISSQDGDTARELMTMHLRRRFRLMEQG